ncbi:MAG: ABC transporter substrate-binding protein [Christensenellales bacterium]|jgi:spermidine/putrescine transport system substrate-binding protein
MKKKLLPLAATLLVALLFSGCASPQKTINVYNWGEYINQDVLRMFEQETGIHVVYTTFASNEEMYAKIKAGAGDYDVLIPSDYMIERLASEGLLHPINWENVPNAALIDDLFKNPGYDPEGLYSVPYMWGTVGICYNTTMVDDPVDSWDILWNEKYARKILMYNSSRDSMMVALRRLGYDMNTRNIDELNEAAQLLAQQKPLVLSYVEDDVNDKMIAGEAALAVMYSGAALESIDQNPDLAYAVPKEGTNIWVDAMVILKSGKHKEEAEAFINFMCRTDIALMNVEEIHYSTPQVEAFAALDEETRNDPGAYPPDEILALCDEFKDLGEFAKEYDELWTRIIAQ